MTSSPASRAASPPCLRIFPSRRLAAGRASLSSKGGPGRVPAALPLFPVPGPDDHDPVDGLLYERLGPDDDDDGMGGTYMLGRMLVLVAAESLMLLAIVFAASAWLGLITWP
jgi:hypothetical protein